jgi:hypothetical protein
VACRVNGACAQQPSCVLRSLLLPYRPSCVLRSLLLPYQTQSVGCDIMRLPLLGGGAIFSPAPKPALVGPEAKCYIFCVVIAIVSLPQRASAQILCKGFTQARFRGFCSPCRTTGFTTHNSTQTRPSQFAICGHPSSKLYDLHVQKWHSNCVIHVSLHLTESDSISLENLSLCS